MNEINFQEELIGFMKQMSHLVGLQEEDIEVPAQGSIIMGRTGISILKRSKPNVVWEIRESFINVEPNGEKHRINRLIATVPEKETIRASQVAFILAFERLLDLEISSLVLYGD